MKCSAGARKSQTIAPNRALPSSLINRSRHSDESCFVSANGRLEFKLPDSIVNPYLSHTVLLASIADGLERGLDPGEPLVGSSYEVEASDRFAPLPLTMGDALRAFESSELVRGALGDDLHDLYGAYKRDEWARACGAITEWDREMYLDWAP